MTANINDQTLRDAINAAKSGRKAEARFLLHDVLLTNPGCESALLWLAWVAESLQDAEGYLSRLLEADPDNPHARQALLTVADLYIRDGIAAAKSNRRDQARLLLSRALRHSPNNEIAMLWLASIAETYQETSVLLLDLLEINPNNVHASSALERIQTRRTLATPQRWHCPICEFEGDKPETRCAQCRAAVSISDVDALLACEEVDHSLVARGVERLERMAEEQSNFDTDLALGLAYLNAGRLADGISQLRTASTARPDDSQLRSAVETLGSKAVAAALRRSRPRRHLTEKTVLVIDDSITIRKVVAATLTSAGYRALVAADGIEALAEVVKVAPDLILLDINMPFMDGHQVCAALKENALTRNIPVVMLSGKDGFFDKVRSRRAGAVRHLSKPIVPVDLLGAVRTLIGAPTAS